MSFKEKNSLKHELETVQIHTQRQEQETEPDYFKMKHHLNKLHNTLVKKKKKISTETPVSQPDPFL
jgi:hypothetical protein